MSNRSAFFSQLFLILVALTCAAQQTPPPRIVSLTSPDGVVLKATYFDAGKPGPGVLLLHQCNRQRKVWDGLAERLASSGVNVLTLDYRGYGESGGTPNDKLSPEEQKKMATEIWPRDFDLALEYLESQPDARGAVAILKLNVVANPNSPNTYDSVADAYLAAGEKDLALQNAKKVLDFCRAIRRTANHGGTL